MKFEERMKRNADTLIESVTSEVRRAFQFDLSYLDEEDWNALYAEMAEEVRPYLCTKDGTLAIEVQYGPNVGDHKFFPISEVIECIGDTDESIEAMASEVDQLAATIRAKKTGDHPHG